jgi:hypothetical protein
MWFLIISVVAFNVVAFLIPKRLSRLEIWATMLFAVILECFSDIYLDLKLDLFGYFKHDAQWGAVLVILGIYPAISTMFLNYYPFERPMQSRVMYVLAWTVFSLLYEVAALKSGYFYYHHWKLWYSALCYPVLLYLLIWDLKYIRKLNTEAK